MRRNWRHPEQRKDEAFLGNWWPSFFDKVGWRTKRRGERAYDERTGIPMNGGDLRPVFAQHAEIEAAPQGHKIRLFLEIDENW